MSEWWTYRLSDFLMFSPRTYWRLVEQYNRDIWPAQLLAAGSGLLLLWLAATPRPGASRAIPAVLAAAWLWVGWAFHWQRYATINWAAHYFAVAFGLQAVLFVLLGVFPRGGRHRAAGAARRNVGWVLAVSGVLLYPLAGLAAGRPWTQAELFAVMPEPTALASLGLLLASAQPHARWLSVVPVLSLLAGLATLWVMAG